MQIIGITNYPPIANDRSNKKNIGYNEEGYYWGHPKEKQS